MWYNLKKEEKNLSQYCIEDQGKLNLENKIMVSKIGCQIFNGHLWCKSKRVVFFNFIIIYLFFYWSSLPVASLFNDQGLNLHLL